MAFTRYNNDYMGLKMLHRALFCDFWGRLKPVVEWFTVSLRVIVPILLTFVGACINDFISLVLGLVDTKISDWNSVVWKPYAHHGKIYFLVIVWLAVLIQIVLEIYIFRENGRKRDELSRLKRQNADLLKEVSDLRILKDNVDSVVKLYLGAVSKTLKMGVNERISLYVLDPDGQSFSISARDSENPDLRIYKRDTFAIDEGIIGLARANGHAYIANLPSYKNAPKNYINVCKEKFERMSATRVKALSMKAQFYYAYRFSSHDNRDFNSIVVIESMNPTFKTEEELNEVFAPNNEFVYMLVKNFGSYMPMIGLAKKEDL